MNDTSHSGPYLVGQLLIAMPGMRDERFAKTVIYMCAHNEEGAMGLVLNQRLESLTFAELMSQLEIDEDNTAKGVPVHFGGPVEAGRGFVLHSDDMVRKETLNIDKGVALTSTAEFFDDLSKGKGPKNCILALGYAGWQPGQLEHEIMRNSWMSLSVDNSFLFDDEVSRKWSQAYKLMGIDPNSLSSESGRA